jgi:hypothetical protein
LQAQVHEAKFRMQMVEIEVLALATFQLELQLFGLAIATQKIGSAWLDASKNPDQALLEMILLNEFPRQNFFARMAGGQIAKRPPGYFGHSQSGRLNALGQLHGKCLEVLEEHAFDLQVGVHRSGTIERRQAAFEPQAVKARKNADDIGAVLGYKFIWSVTGCGRMFVFHTTILPARRHSVCPPQENFRHSRNQKRTAFHTMPKRDEPFKSRPLLVAAVPLWEIRGNISSV